MTDTALQILKAERERRVAAFAADIANLDAAIASLRSSEPLVVHAPAPRPAVRAMDIVTEKPVVAAPAPEPVTQPAPTPQAAQPAPTPAPEPGVAQAVAAAPVAPWEQGAGETPPEKKGGRRSHEQMAADAGVTLDEVKGWKQRQGHTETKIVKADIEAAGAAKKAYLDSQALAGQPQAPQEQPSTPAPAQAPQAAVAQPVQPAPTPSGPIQAQDFPTEPMQTEPYQAPEAPQAQQQAAQPAAPAGAPAFSSPW